MKNWPPNMNLQNIAGHLNVPVGPVVTPEEVATVLRTGSLASVGEPASSVLAYLFIECSPSAIVACVREAGASLESAQRLYAETLASGMPPVSGWEEFVDHSS